MGDISFSLKNISCFIVFSQSHLINSIIHVPTLTFKNSLSTSTFKIPKILELHTMNATKFIIFHYFLLSYIFGGGGGGGGGRGRRGGGGEAKCRILLPF